MPMTRRRLKETRRNGRICLFNNFPVFLIILLLMFLYLRNMCWRASLTSVAMMKSVGRYQHTDWIPWERGLEIVATAVWKTEEGWCEIMQNNNNKKKKEKKERKKCVQNPGMFSSFWMMSQEELIPWALRVLCFSSSLLALLFKNYFFSKIIFLPPLLTREQSQSLAIAQLALLGSLCRRWWLCFH